MMATVVHFDISADNPERAMKFYETLFGWKITSIPGFADYYEIDTGDLNGKKGVGGGITNFIGVSSIDETIVKLSSLGGKIIQSKQAVPGYGFLALCTDTENNVIGLFQEDKNAG